MSTREATKVDWKGWAYVVVAVFGVVFVCGKQVNDNDNNTKAVAEQRAELGELKTHVEVAASEAKSIRSDAAEMRDVMHEMREKLDRIDKHVIAECAARTHNPEACAK